MTNDFLSEPVTQNQISSVAEKLAEDAYRYLGHEVEFRKYRHSGGPQGLIESFQKILRDSPPPQYLVLGLKEDVEAVFRRHIEAFPYLKEVLKRIAFEVVPLIVDATGEENRRG
jgi:hypothetical protein